MRFEHCLRWSFVLGTLVTFSLGCGRDLPGSSQVATIFGQNDLVPVTRETRQGLSRAVGSLAVILEIEGQRSAIPHCTAIRLGMRHLLTAAHCVRENIIFNPWALVAPQGDQDQGFEILQFGEVLRLHYGGELDPQSENWVSTAPALGSPVYVNPLLDVAIYALDLSYQEALKSLGPGLPLPRSFQNPVALSIWGHPNGVPLATADCTEGQEVDGVWYYHDCDALTGSSGGLIGDPISQRPVAMQLAGPAKNRGSFYSQHGVFETPEDFAAKRGCAPVKPHDPESKACVTRRGMNRAVPLHVITEDLSANRPELVDQINPK